MPLTDRCLCGAVKYETDAEPHSMTYCHCADCRRMTGSAFNVGVAVPRESLRVTGETKSYEVPVAGGRRREFCPTCGSPMFTLYPRMAFIKAGTVDDPGSLQPTRQIWTEDRVPWAQVPAEIVSFPQGDTR